MLTSRLLSQIAYHRLFNHREPFSLLSKSCRRRPWCRLPGDLFHILYFRRRLSRGGTRVECCPSDLISRRVLRLSLLCRSLSPFLLRHRSGSQVSLSLSSILHSHSQRVSGPETRTVHHPPPAAPHLEFLLFSAVGSGKGADTLTVWSSAPSYHHARGTCLACDSFHGKTGNL